ncbi:MAG: succinate dehydrogenase, cytochrome b556 subunit [Sphingomonadales bacterium 32-68-7]|nr:MAG: succinate dehydrogenase, cytochrome b556 subunit [Sphingomonadales bacterium 12-68-11]OYX08492.1 MAG: succinate dehydrogenase, cytochrome b556 subunit [Sphingomonadales bacterium 32-68-7]
MATRPLSPHLSIWKWGPAMLVSILHRVTGSGMAFAALPVLLWWLAALAGGEASYATFAGHAGSWYGLVILVGISWAFFNHLCSGLRHFVLDVGAGYAVEANNRWSVVTTVSGVVLTAAFWAAIVLG